MKKVHLVLSIGANRQTLPGSADRAFALLVKDALHQFDKHLFDHTRTSIRYQAVQVGAMRDLCDWYELIYGSPLTFVDLTPSVLGRYRQQRRQFDATPTLNRKRVAWCAFCEWAIAQGWLTENPCAQIPRLKVLPGATRRRVRP